MKSIRSEHKKVQTNAYLFQHGHTVCKFSGKSPLSSHNTTLKQQINGQKQYIYIKCKKKTCLALVEFLQFVRCLEDCWHDLVLER